MITALTGFFTGTVSDNVAKLLQPVGSFPATLFVLLNLAFIYPAAREDHVRIAERFAALDSGWQLVVVATAILSLGYLLLNISGLVVQLLGGQGWRQTFLHRVLARRAKNRRDRLAAAAQPAGALLEQWHLAMYFPTEDRVEATALGNALAATQDVVNTRYGIDIAALWSDMEVAAPADSAALASVKDERVGLDLLANLTFVLAAFTVEAVVFFDAHRAWTSALLSLFGALAAIGAYRAAVAKANSWGVAIATVFDLEREKLWSALGLRAAQTASEEKVLWERASKFYLPLARDDEPLPQVPSGGDLWDAVEAPLSLQATDNVAARALSRAVVSDAPFVGANGFVWFAFVEYVLTATRREGPIPFPGVDAAVTAADAAVKRITAVDGPDNAVVLRNRDGSDLLLWRFQGLVGDSERMVRYRVPTWGARVDPAEIECSVGFDDAGFYTLMLRNRTNRPHTPTLTLVHNADPSDPRAPRLTYEGQPERAFAKTFGQLAAQALALVTVELPEGV